MGLWTPVPSSPGMLAESVSYIGFLPKVSFRQSSATVKKKKKGKGKEKVKMKDEKKMRAIVPVPSLG